MDKKQLLELLKSLKVDMDWSESYDRDYKRGYIQAIERIEEEINESD